jgi:hypothetical protein
MSIAGRSDTPPRLGRFQVGAASSRGPLERFARYRWAPFPWKTFEALGVT